MHVHSKIARGIVYSSALFALALPPAKSQFQKEKDRIDQVDNKKDAYANPLIGVGATVALYSLFYGPLIWYAWKRREKPMPVDSKSPATA